MTKLRKRLPPAATLAHFEAAARFGNFTRAAEELGVTQAAVSRQIRLLEENLGVSLFRRLHRSVHLTEAGREFFEAVGTGLRHIAQTADEIRAVSKTPYLTVLTTMVFATHWLMPRIPGFRAHHPGIDIRLVASDPFGDTQHLEGDVSIRYAQRESAPPGAKLLLGEEIFPVCSPDYLDRRGPLADLRALSHERLLHLVEFRRPTMGWRDWFAARGIDYAPPPGTEPYPNYSSVIEAARAGAGVALGWHHLVDELLEREILVRPLDVSVTTDWAYFVQIPPGALARPETTAFVDWLFAEVARAPERVA